MTPPTQHDVLKLAAAVREAAAKEAGKREHLYMLPSDTQESIYRGIRNMDLSALVAAHGNPTPQDAQDGQRSATVGPCELGRLKAEIERLHDLAGQLHAALRAVNAVAIERGDKYGVCDQIDNTGQPYPSQWICDLLALPIAPLDRPNSHGTTVESAPSATASEGLSEGVAGEPVAWMVKWTERFGEQQSVVYDKLDTAEGFIRFNGSGELIPLIAAPQPATKGETA